MTVNQPDMKDFLIVPNVLFFCIFIISTFEIIMQLHGTMLLFISTVIKHIFTGKQVVISELLANSVRIFIPHRIDINLDYGYCNYISIFDYKNNIKENISSYTRIGNDYFY